MADVDSPGSGGFEAFRAGFQPDTVHTWVTLKSQGHHELDK
jgi:hypothetical protein